MKTKKRSKRASARRSGKPRTRPPLSRPHDGRTRPPGEPLADELTESFREVEPPPFRDHPDSAIEAAATDPDVEDSEGGE